jgi:mono/diheme cytochrome c family protein
MLGSAAKILLLTATIAIAAPAADPAVIEKGRAEEKRACVGCHGLRIVHVQRLSRASWERELDKMVRWGSVIRDRESLLTYLASEYGDDKPVAPLPRSADGVAAARKKQ